MQKTVLITGGSGGIGFELAKQFAEHQHDLILVGKDPQKLHEAKEKLSTFDVGVTTLIFDLTRGDSAKKLHETIKNPISVLVNNAGFGWSGELIKQDFENLTQMLQLNAVTLTQLCRLFGARMVEQKSGKIMNIASVAGFFPGPLMSVYYASKAYVVSFTESLAEELVGTGVTVSCLCPGPTDTGFQKRAQMERSKLFSMQMMTPKQVAQIGYQGLMDGKRLIIPGIINQLQVFGSKIVPRTWEARAIKRLHKE